MRQLPLLFISLLFYTFINAQNDKIYFTDIGLEEALKLASEENKNVFIFLANLQSSTTSFFETAIFHKGKVGNRFNQDFINLKVSVDSAEGSQLIKKYSIIKLPAFIAISPEGSSKLGYDIKNTQLLINFANSFKLE